MLPRWTSLLSLTHPRALKCMQLQTPSRMHQKTGMQSTVKPLSRLLFARSRKTTKCLQLLLRAYQMEMYCTSVLCSSMANITKLLNIHTHTRNGWWNNKVCVAMLGYYLWINDYWRCCWKNHPVPKIAGHRSCAVRWSKA